MVGMADVNGARLAYESLGDGEPVVMVHGFTLDMRMWDDQLDVFAASYRIVRYDLRGFGKSSVPDGKPYLHADDLAALLDQIHIDRAHVMGLSMGGGVALEFACLYPNRLNTLLLVDAAMGGYPWTMALDYEQGATSVAEIRRNWLAHALFAPALRNPHAAIRLTQIVNDYSGWHWQHVDNNHFPPPSVYERLEEIQVRTLAVVGAWELPDFLGIADTIAARVPHAHKAVIAGAGHMCNMEQPAEFNQIALDFLAGLS